MSRRSKDISRLSRLSKEVSRLIRISKEVSRLSMMRMGEGKVQPVSN